MVLLHDPGQLAAESDGQDSPFEFFTTATLEICAADDVILGGELLPFGAPPPSRPKKAEIHVNKFLDGDHRRSSSLGEPPRGCWGSRVTGGGGHRRLRKVPDPDHKEAPAQPEPRRPRPRWYVLVFGSVRVPAAMELREIRIRQRRTSLPPPPTKEARDSGEWSPWKLLRSLSCKGMEAVIVA